jgi:hypothetical protein
MTFRCRCVRPDQLCLRAAGIVEGSRAENQPAFPLFVSSRRANFWPLCKKNATTSTLKFQVHSKNHRYFQNHFVFNARHAACLGTVYEMTFLFE